MRPTHSSRGSTIPIAHALQAVPGSKAVVRPPISRRRKSIVELFGFYKGEQQRLESLSNQRGSNGSSTFSTSLFAPKMQPVFLAGSRYGMVELLGKGISGSPALWGTSDDLRHTAEKLLGIELLAKRSAIFSGETRTARSGFVE